MNDDVNNEVLNGTPKILIPFDGVVNWDGVLKSSSMLEGDHNTHFWGWIERSVAQSSIWKCSYGDDIIEKGPMMWVSSTMDGNT
jgi:hypothetical protein